MANLDYGDFTPTLTVAAKDERWRVNANSNFIADQLNSPFSYAQIDGGKTPVCRNSSNESKEFHAPPSEWTKFLLLIGRCRIHYYRDWVRIDEFIGKFVTRKFNNFQPTDCYTPENITAHLHCYPGRTDVWRLGNECYEECCKCWAIFDWRMLSMVHVHNA